MRVRIGLNMSMGTRSNLRLLYKVEKLAETPHGNISWRLCSRLIMLQHLLQAFQQSMLHEYGKSAYLIVPKLMILV